MHTMQLGSFVILLWPYTFLQPLGEFKDLLMNPTHRTARAEHADMNK